MVENTEQKSGYKVKLIGNKCYRCGHEWLQRDQDKPTICPKCKSPYWDKPRQNKQEK